jgi:GTPase Era involved in 16S rRNA processing
MSNFFDSEIIQDELKEINELQEFLYANVFAFGSLSNAEKLEHIAKMTTLLDKQKVMYTRLMLSDDPDAIKMKEQIKKSIALMGFPTDTDMNTMFDAMHKTIKSLKQYLDK